MGGAVRFAGIAYGVRGREHKILRGLCSTPDRRSSIMPLEYAAIGVFVHTEPGGGGLSLFYISLGLPRIFDLGEFLKGVTT